MRLQELTNVVDVVLDRRLDTLGWVRHDYETTGYVGNVQLTFVHSTVNKRYQTARTLQAIQ